MNDIINTMQRNLIFSKAPLKEVIFEITFAPNISAACRKDDFYSEIIKEYPEVVFPNITFEQHPFAQPVQYINSEKTKKITCSSQSLSLSTIKYEGFTIFKDESVRLIERFLQKYPTIQSIKRIGFRYINQIPIERKNEKIEFSDILNFNFTLPTPISHNKLEVFQTAFFYELEQNTSGIKISMNSYKDNQNKEYLILDFDLISLKEIKPNEIERYLVSYHEKIENIFLEITTNKYQQSIK